MSTTTTNLGLTLTGTSQADVSMIFSTWRQIINGEGNNSNMEIIDKAYGDMTARMNTMEQNNTDTSEALNTVQENFNNLEQDVDSIAQDLSAASEDIDSLEDRTATAEGNISSLQTGLNTANQNISDLEAALEKASRVHRYGVLWDKTNAACTRLYDAVGLTANAHKGSYNASLVNDFDNLYPWSGRKLCNVDVATYQVLHANGEDIANAIVAWEGDPDFSYTGANGAVMVYTPEFWMRAEETSVGVELVIADGELPGYIHVPTIIGGRYWASSDGNGGVTSVAGVIPIVNTAMTTIHTNAKAVDMTLDDIWTYTAESMMMVIEFANMNTQTALGNGVSSLYRQDATDMPLTEIAGSNYVIAPVALANVACVNAILDIGTSSGGIQVGKRIITSIEDYSANTSYKIIRFAGDPIDVTTTQYLSIHGLSNVADEQIGSASGYIGTNGKANAYYRGRVAHANIWRYVLGAYRQTGTGHIWIAHSREEASNYDALDTSVHMDTGCVLPYDDAGTNKEGYIQTLHFLSTLPLAPFCATVGGNSSNPVGDYCYHPAKTAGNTILICGGNAGNGAGGGRFYGNWGSAASSSNWYIGALPFLK